ncbi:hypothetical protein DMJ13_09735 [halophilic archaeon]|nr:hypothetical protein DMJ13_09735 [halophilic archaeon]
MLTCLMKPTRRTVLQASAIGFASSIVGVAGANENRQETTTEAGSGTTERDETTPFTVRATTLPEHGVVLTDAEGMTLYRFTEDEAGESTCYDDCAEAWPPLTVEESPTIPDGLPGEFATTEREDGSMQVTYDGTPLYSFARDEEPGDANGQGVGDVWFVVNPACPSEDETTEETTTGGNY